MAHLKSVVFKVKTHHSDKYFLHMLQSSHTLDA